jgi:hypothetical protein
MQAYIQDTVCLEEDLLSAVAMMGVNVQNQNPFQSAISKEMLGCDRDIVENAETPP